MAVDGKRLNAADKRRQFRRILDGEECVSAPQVFDPISARIADDLGFSVGIGAPPNFELAILGAPELGLVTVSEIAEQTRRICRASNLGFIVAGARGIGNALNVMRAVEEFENAGAVAFAIEYQRLPVAFDSPTFRAAMDRPITVRRDIDYEPSLDIDEIVGRVRAAIDARQDGLVVIGRVRVEPDVPDAIRLIKAYESAGAEALWLGQIYKEESLEAVHAATALPLLVGGSITDVGVRRGRSYLAAQGVRVVSLGRVTLLASMKGVYEALKAHSEGKFESQMASFIAPRELESRVAWEPQYDEWIKSYMMSARTGVK